MINPMMQFTWNPAWVQPYESLFCILQKFLRVNVSNVRELQRTFGLMSKRDQPQNWGGGDRDLHKFGALDPSMLRRVLRLSHDALEAAVASSCLRDRELKAVTSPIWRICPACLSEGFHATLYQLAFVAQCPIHTVDLQTTCPSCGTGLPLYALRTDSFSPSCGCPSCGMIWWQPGQRSSNQPVEAEQRTLLLKESYDWLIRRTQLPAVEPDLWKLSKFGYDARGLSDSVRSLLHRWADVMGCALPQTLSSPKRPMRHCQLSLPVETEAEASGVSDNDAVHLYRVVRRHLRRGVLTYHRHCIETLGRSLWWNATRREVVARGICHHAYAYLLWRMYWEKIEVPRNLFFSQRRLWHEKPLVSCDWLPPNVPQDVGSRLFVLECVQTYERCLLLATKLQQEGRLLFPLWQIGESSKVEWLLKQAGSGQEMQLHWWWPSSYSELVRPSRHRGSRRAERRRRRRLSRKLTCLAC